MHINSKKYPLHVSKEIEQVLAELKQLTQSGDLDFLLVRNTMHLLSITDKDSSSGFYFNILHAGINKQKQVVFTVNCLPGNGYSTVAAAMELSSEALVQKLNWWTGIITDYNNINHNLEKWDLNFIETTQDLAFELQDSDAGTHPFEEHKQVMIEKLLQNIITLLEERKEQDGVAALLEETQNIGEELKTATKNWVVAKLVALLKKLGLIGLEFIREVLKLSAAELLQLGFKAM